MPGLEIGGIAACLNGESAVEVVDDDAPRALGHPGTGLYPYERFAIQWVLLVDLVV